MYVNAVVHELESVSIGFALMVLVAVYVVNLFVALVGVIARVSGREQFDLGCDPGICPA